MGVTTFHKKDYGVFNQHHVTPASVYTLESYGTCKSPGIKKRKHILPLFRCNNRHTFNEPDESLKTVEFYVAEYGGTFTPFSENIPVIYLKKAAMRPNDQLAIEELDLYKIDKIVFEKIAESNSLVKDFIQSISINSNEAVESSATELSESPAPYEKSPLDMREEVMKSIKVRRGQKKFREGLKKEYGIICMVTGCSMWEIIEAAHIDPYRGFNDNDLRNGLLLRADLHTLFDLNLMAIEPVNLTIHFHSLASTNGYGEFEGKKLKVTKTCRPALEPLNRRWLIFKKLT